MTRNDSVRCLLTALLAAVLMLSSAALRAQEGIVIPVGLPEVDLSRMNLAARTAPLVVTQSCRLVNGSVTAAAGFGTDTCLVCVRGAVTVVIDATASVNAAQASPTACKGAVGLFEGATLVQYGDIIAPADGQGTAVYFGDDTTDYEQRAGTRKGVLADRDGVIEQFEVEPNDLLALRNMHQAWNGDSWAQHRWKLNTRRRHREDFPGVTFTDDGRVTAIDLSGDGLEGTLFDVTPPQLSALVALDLSNNSLSGDVGRLVVNMERLQKLNLSYNCLTEVSAAIPATCTYVNLQYQNRQQGDADALAEHFALLKPLSILVKTNGTQQLELPSLWARASEHVLYPPATLTGDYYAALHLPSGSDPRLTLGYSHSGRYTLPQDQPAVLVSSSGDTRGSAYPALLHYAEGDADMTGETDVLDVQHTLNYILSPATVASFNCSAANTYAGDDIINVQDIVATVNILLDAPAAAREDHAPGAGQHAGRLPADEQAEGTLYTAGDRLMLHAAKAVAALDIELQGVTTSQVSLLLNRRDFQMIGRNTDSGSRYVIFSPTGQSIPAATATAVLRLAAAAQPVAACCADPQAQPVTIAIGSEATGIAELNSLESSPEGIAYSLHGHRLDAGRLRKGIYIQNRRKVVK